MMFRCPSCQELKDETAFFSRSMICRACDRAESEAWSAHMMKGHYARQALQAAVAKRTLIRPAVCSVCGRNDYPRGVDGHHPDYDKPLEVVWLCRRCHRQAHCKQRIIA